MLAMLCAGLSQMRGGAWERARKHIWLLIFLVLFVSRQKEHKEELEHLDLSVSVANQIKKTV